jgi:hypothetical protein
MTAGGAGLKTIAVLLTIALSACGGGESDGRANNGDAAAPTESTASDDEILNLCGTAAARDLGALDSDSMKDIAENLQEVIDAHRDLLSALEEADPPEGSEAGREDYVAELGTYVDAMERGYGDEGSDRDALAALVEIAESGIELEELRDDAGLPEQCPPGTEMDMHNTLFVATANLGCFDLGHEVLEADVPEKPESAKEISLVLQLAQRLSAGIAEVILDADSPEVDEIPVEELVEAQKARIQAVEGLANAYGERYAVFKAAGKELQRASRRADELALSVGLIHCAKAFSLLPF